MCIPRYGFCKETGVLVVIKEKMHTFRLAIGILSLLSYRREDFFCKDYMINLPALPIDKVSGIWYTDYRMVRVSGRLTCHSARVIPLSGSGSPPQRSDGYVSYIGRR